MAKQTIPLNYGTTALWNRVAGRKSAFLDTNAWIHMADGLDDTAARVRRRLSLLVAAGKLVCPVSSGTLEELYLQAGTSLGRTAALMEELSLNACYVTRNEVFQWEFGRSFARVLNAPWDDSLRGLYTVPAAYLGSNPCATLTFPEGQRLTDYTVVNIQQYFSHEQSAIGVTELAMKLSGPRPTEDPPAYSDAAKKTMARFNGEKGKIFAAEAENCFSMYITPLLHLFPVFAAEKWRTHFGSADDCEKWYRRVLADLPALYNFVDLMVEADMQPARKDSNNHFMDNEIMIAPLAYADVFVSTDRGIRDVLRNRTKILERTGCNYCDSLTAFESWIERVSS